jgi:hypothetical protein
MPVPWDRQPNESSKAFAAFCLYLDLGPQRSVAKAYRLHTGRKQAAVSGTWNLWRSKYRWKNRAQAFDDNIFHELSIAHRQAKMEVGRLRLTRQVQTQSAFANLSDQLLARVEATLPGLSLIDEVSPNPGGGRTAKRGNSPAYLARLLRQLRDLESCLAHGFPQPPRATG